MYPIVAPPISDGTVVVAGSTIAYVGPRASAPPGDDLDLGDVILAPGLVNAHTHLDLTALRGTLDGLAFFDWIRAIVAARAKLTAEQLLESSRAGIREGLQAGITTFADTAANDAPFRAMLELGVRGIAYREVFGPDPAQCDASMSELSGAVAAMRASENDLVRVGVSPHAPYSVSDELYSAAAKFARDEKLPLATHVAESDAESDLVTKGDGDFSGFLKSRNIETKRRAKSPIALLQKTGVLAENALLIHCVRCDDADIATISKHGAGVATCPASNNFFGHGAARVASMRLAGIRVGAGSDSMASNVRMDVLHEARLALGAKAHESAVWELATLGGARALRLDHLIGSLEPGKQADLAAFSSVDPAHASFVMVAGRELFRA